MPRTSLTLLLISMACFLANPWAGAATRDPVFSVLSGTTFTAPRQVAVSVPYNGETRLTRDGSTPTSSSPLYSGPLTIRWSETIKAISIVGGVSSNVVSASYTLDAIKYPAPAAGGTVAPVINLQTPTTAQ